MTTRTVDESSAQLVATAPVPIWIVVLPDDIQASDTVDNLRALTRSLFRQAGLHALRPFFRSVGVDRLPNVLATGIDVEPTSAVFYVDRSPGKAWKYGGFPKVLIALDPEQVMQTWLEVPVDTAPEELERLRSTFPTRIRMPDTYWFSRLAEDDPQLGRSYEIEYAKWIPKNPHDALRGIFIFLRPGDAQILEAALQVG